MPYRLPHTTREVLQLDTSFMRGRALDLGAGTGKYKKYIVPHVQSYVACDMAPGGNIDVVTDVHDLPFENSSFDTVICTQVLEHVERPWEVIAEISRVLAPGGRCILTTPFLESYHAVPHDYFRYTTEGGESLFVNVGMKILKLEKYGGVGVVLAEMWKFAFCSPHDYAHPGFFRRNIYRVVHTILCALSNHPNEKSLMYANIHIVAEKPSTPLRLTQP